MTKTGTAGIDVIMYAMAIMWRQDHFFFIFAFDGGLLFYSATVRTHASNHEIERLVWFSKAIGTRRNVTTCQEAMTVDWTIWIYPELLEPTCPKGTSLLSYAVACWASGPLVCPRSMWSISLPEAFSSCINSALSSARFGMSRTALQDGQLTFLPACSTPTLS